MNRFILLVFCLACFFNAYAQKAIVKGIVYEEDGLTPAPFVSVATEDGEGQVETDFDGKYALEIPEGKVLLIFTSVEHGESKKTVEAVSGQTTTLNVSMGQGINTIKAVKVTASSRISKNIEKESISTEVLGVQQIENTAITDVSNVIEKAPGVVVVDGQPNIRGGSGWAFGAGSRSLLVVDDIPLLSSDRGDIKWDFVPIENIDQIEVIKGASSVQYGSSALNGMIHVKTTWPTDTVPRGKLALIGNITDFPPKSVYKWWNREEIKRPFSKRPSQASTYFLYKQKFDQVDFVLGGLLEGRQSHLENEIDRHYRFNVKFRHRPKNKPRINWGINTNLYRRFDQYHILWQPDLADGQGNTIANNHTGASVPLIDFFAFVDPFFNAEDKRNGFHQVKTRYFVTQNGAPKLSKQTVHQFYADYRYSKTFKNIVTLTAGASNLGAVLRDQAIAGGRLNLANGSIYAQAEARWKALSVNAGIRAEYFALISPEDTIGGFSPSLPVVNFGINYAIPKNHYVRFNIGQGFRVPSPVEVFAEAELLRQDVDLEGRVIRDIPIKVLNNTELKPETGFTTEVGYKYKLEKGKKWRAYFDLAMFFNQYKNYIEPIFQIDVNVLNPNLTAGQRDSLRIGFQFVNLPKVWIGGWEFSSSATGHITKDLELNFLIGYSYNYAAMVGDYRLNPLLSVIDLNPVLEGMESNFGTFVANSFKAFAIKDPLDKEAEINRSLLPFRFRHTLNADIDVKWKRLFMGTTLRVYSFPTPIRPDAFTRFIGGLQNYLENKNTRADAVWDLRIGVKAHKHLNLTFNINNVLNTDYMIRPTRLEQPRNYTLQALMHF